MKGFGSKPRKKINKKNCWKVANLAKNNFGVPSDKSLYGYGIRTFNDPETGNWVMMDFSSYPQLWDLPWIVKDPQVIHALKQLQSVSKTSVLEGEI